ncbi:hypothetical protein MMC29_002301 [Sticta canariensis]|nr:hypothetical protein [Sticta canariensis]
MFGWLTGSSRPVETQGVHGEDDQSYLDDPPETPAPVFAIRAFKSALFGTPHIDSEIRPTTPSPMAADRKAGKKDHAAPFEPTDSTKIRQKSDEEDFSKPRASSLVSPSKGILLTPGTGTARRKNVTFGGLALNEKSSAEDSRQMDSILRLEVNKPSIAKALPIDQHRQTGLTKALYKAKIGPSKTKPNEGAGDVVSEDQFLPFEPIAGYRVKTDGQDEVVDLSADTTIDLNKPFSTSGKHWKAKYERYHQKSDREMKEIIKYGQSIKSFAVKKDSEASELGEKLHLQLSKVAVMEAKVSRLAIQLASARAPGSEDADQAQLVTDLAKQTALALRYKQKADRYRSALLKKTSTVSQAENGVETALVQSAKNLTVDSSHVSDNAREMASLRSELDRVRDSSELAKEKAKVLEAENVTLRESIRRLKAGAADYETERLAREEDFKKRAAIMKSAREDCEVRLNQIAADHQKLLHQSPFQEGTQGSAGNQTKEVSESAEKSKPLDLRDAAVAPKAIVPKVISQPSKSAHRIKPEQSHVDIWTLSAQGNRLNEISSGKKPTFDQDEHTKSDIFGALREIDQNLISERISGDPLPSFSRDSIPRTPSKQHKRHHRSELLPDIAPRKGPIEPTSQNPSLPGPPPVKSSASKRMRERRSNISSPRPSLLNFTSSPPKTISSDFVMPDSNPQLTSLEASLPTTSSAPVLTASLVSAAASRTSTLAGGRRQSTLPAERAAAARARLKERNIEKMMTEGRRDGRVWKRVKADGKGEIVTVGGSGGGGSDGQGKKSQGG